MLVRILHRLGIVRGVWLQDRWGKLYITIKRHDPFGDHWVHVYPFLRIGRVVLNADGTCSSESSTYIERWVDF